MVEMNKKILLEQFAACYDKNDWFVAVRNAVDGLTAEQAAWKPSGAQHSIWELVSHLCHDNNACLQRFQGIEYTSRAANNDETFDPVGGTWEADLERFEAIMIKWLELLNNADDAKLNELAQHRNETNWGMEIANMNAHNAYHGGQIVMLRKLQESWNPERGVS